VTTIDLDHLQEAILGYFEYFRRLSSTAREERLEAQLGNPLDDWLFGVIHMQEGRADEAVWPVVLAMVEAAPDEAALAIVGAGPLEDLAWYHGSQFGDRLVDMARSDPRFRMAISGFLGWDRIPEPHRSQLLGILGAGGDRSPHGEGPQPSRRRRRPKSDDIPAR
jgi:hypothetical protein